MRFIPLLGFLLFCTSLMAQKQMELASCEELFLKNNLLLLAENYNVSAAQAAVVQARIWDLPVLTGEMNTYNPNNNHLFDVGAKGQKAATVQQLIYLGGKKHKQTAWASASAELSQIQFEQLLRNLRYELHTTFYSLYFNRQRASNLSSLVSNLDSLVNAYTEQTNKGNVSLKDLVRLQSLTLGFRNDLIQTYEQITEDQKTLKLLTASSEEILPMISTSELEKSFLKQPVLSLDQLVQKALEKNPDLLAEQKKIESNERMLEWQKSLAIPDLTLGGAYDQRGGAFMNQVNLTFGIPLPLWNRNKGNIKMSEDYLNESKLLREQKTLQVRLEIESVTELIKRLGEQYERIINNSKDLETVYKGVLTNFKTRNISLIEFTDFIESYVETTTLLNDIKLKLITNHETLNYLVNEPIL